MADDRLYIVCKKCRKHTLIATLFLTGRWRASRGVGESLSSFIREHAECYTNDEDYWQNFAMIYENSEEGLQFDFPDVDAILFAQEQKEVRNE